VQRGEVFGYLGPNGAGKTTTIRTLLDFIRPSQGRAAVLGLDAHGQSLQVRRKVGYLPGEMALYESLNGAEMLSYMGHLRCGLDPQYLERLTERLDCNLRQPIRTLSHGNKQKIGLVQAFMHRPELLILDEPTTGLDPLVQQEFYRMVGEVKAEGRTVFLSSHILPEVERVCDRVGVIREGRLIAVEQVAALKARAVRRLEIHFSSDVPVAAFQDVSGVRDITVEGPVLTCTVMGMLDALVKAAAQFEVMNIVSHEPNLEEIFLTMYNEGGGHAA
jgi:ABC-2 type transport system ATP-binding protein